MSLLYSSRICLYWKKVAVAPVSFTLTGVPALAGVAGGVIGVGDAVTVWVAVTVTVGAVAGVVVEQPATDKIATVNRPALFLNSVPQVQQISNLVFEPS